MSYKKKICLISSSGGHYEQLRMLDKLKNNFEIVYVTERTLYNKSEDGTYYLHQVNRQERTMPFWMGINFFQSLYIFFKEKPEIIITTGVLAVIPMIIVGKIFRKKIIYIESFAKSESPTITGKFLYGRVDVFIVQWETMKKYYPEAIYLGSIY